jgi:predicted O-linked N-acetylglucosamine transferase (SPINDLY family)
VVNLAYHGRNNRALKEKIAAVFELYFRDQPKARGSGLASKRRIGVVVTQRHEGIFIRCMKGVLERLDPKAFELVVICSGASVEMIRKAIHRDDLSYVTIPHSLPEAVERIRAAACDLIYYWEVGSDSMNYLLPFARLAPVQCTSHGSFQNTTGVAALDYYMSSGLVEAECAASHYTERLWNSKTLLMHQTRLPQVSPATRGSFQLPDGRNIYLCLQNPMKLHPDFYPILKQILEADAKAVIVLAGGRHGHLLKHLRQLFCELFGGLSDRIVIVPWLGFEDYCRLLQLADVVLDPPHFTAGCTAYDIFSFHQPIVTMPGELAASRVTAACYAKMGMNELVVQTPQEYVAQAVRVGSERDYRMALRDRIRKADEQLFGDSEAVREYERFFREATPIASPPPA